MHQERQWEALPSLALANIFCRISITDRSRRIPFVCSSWARAARHPPCWVSMIAENHYQPPDFAADHAFVKASRPESLSFVDPFDGRRSPDPHRGLASFQGFIGRSGGAAAAAVSSIYFFPFLTAAGGPPNDDAILRVIAQWTLIGDGGSRILHVEIWTYQPSMYSHFLQLPQLEAPFFPWIQQCFSRSNI